MIKIVSIFVLSSFCIGVFAEEIQTLNNTQPLTWEEDLSGRLMDGAHRFVERKIDESIKSRQNLWERDFSSKKAYLKSVEPNRIRFKQYIGVVDQRVPVTMEYYGDEKNSALVAETEQYKIFQVRWQVLEKLTGEGLLLKPNKTPIGYIVALPDAGQTPEQIAGLSNRVNPEHQYARYLVENGFEVIVPMLINRRQHENQYPDFRKTGQTNREWIYRQAFHMGRHVIGYEVQKVLAAVDWFESKNNQDARVGVMGYGEGGLIAYYSAAIDTRIDTVLVSGYFDSRQSVWSEPIYRNVWALLHEFGDAELATLIAPRTLIVEYSPFPEVNDNKGTIKTPRFQRVLDEFKRIDELLKPGFLAKTLLRGSNNETIGPGSEKALKSFTQQVTKVEFYKMSTPLLIDNRESFDSKKRHDRQLLELEDHIQGLVRASEHVRDQFYLYKVLPQFAERKWSTKLHHPSHSPQHFIENSKWYRQYFHKELMGTFDEPILPPNAKTRKIYDTEKWTGYDVVILLTIFFPQIEGVLCTNRIDLEHVLML